MQSQSDQHTLYNNNKEMEQVDGDNEVVVYPQNAITFYRNHFQSAATITITRRTKASVKYSIKTTNREAYRVSSSNGQFQEGQQKKYIDIMIEQNTHLEQCLMDRFKLILWINGKAPKYKKFKVIIDYKKDSKIKQKNLNYLQTSSRTSGSNTSTAATSVFGFTTPQLAKKGPVKQPKSYLPKGAEAERNNLKLQLNEVVKQVQQRRLRFEFLQQQHLKKSFRKKIGCYITILVIILCFIIGIAFRKIVFTALLQFEYYL